MTDLTFWTNPMSRGRIVRWMLEEIGAPYDAVVLGYGEEMRTPDFLAVNPMGKVPAIRHGGQVVTEASAICLYLAEAFPDAGLLPPPERRGALLRWMFFGAGPVEAAVTNAANGWRADGPETEGMLGYGSLERVADVLGGLLAGGGPYLLGERFCVLDVYLGSQIAWGRQFGTLPDRPGFDAYAARIADRPASRRAREIDDALLASRDGAP